MSDRPKQPYATMRHCAELLVEKLRPACDRIEIAGSLRRHKPLVSDIELIAIPKHIPNLLGEPSGHTELDALLDTLPVNFTKRGRKYMQFNFDGSHLPFWVDLFVQPDPATWGVNYLLRTGPSEFSKRMVTSKLYGGYKPEPYTVENGRVRMAGMLLPTPEEIDVFKLWKMDYVEPEQRS